MGDWRARRTNTFNRDASTVCNHGRKRYQILDPRPAPRP
jgi:hypothetical protein